MLRMPLSRQSDPLPGAYKIEYAERTQWEMQKSDFHEHYEIFIALSGFVRCFANGGLYDVQRGDVFFFHPHTLHRTVTTGDGTYKRYVVSFREDWITEFIPSFAELIKACRAGGVMAHLDEGRLGELVSLVERAERVGEPDDFREMRIRMAFAEILLYLCPLFRSEKGAPNPTGDASLIKVEAIARYIREHLDADLSLDHLAGKFYLAKSYLCRLFKRHTGYSVNEYIVNCRLLRARRLLSDGSSVAQACERSGFGDYTHFIRTFTRHMGVSPKQYAKTAIAMGK